MIDLGVFAWFHISFLDADKADDEVEEHDYAAHQEQVVADGVQADDGEQQVVVVEPSHVLIAEHAAFSVGRAKSGKIGRKTQILALNRQI